MVVLNVVGCNCDLSIELHFSIKQEISNCPASVFSSRNGNIACDHGIISLSASTLKLSMHMIFQSAGNTSKNGEIQNGNEATDKGKIPVASMFSKLPEVIWQCQIFFLMLHQLSKYSIICASTNALLIMLMKNPILGRTY